MILASVFSSCWSYQLIFWVTRWFKIALHVPSLNCCQKRSNELFDLAGHLHLQSSDQLSRTINEGPFKPYFVDKLRAVATRWLINDFSGCHLVLPLAVVELIFISFLRKQGSKIVIPRTFQEHFKIGFMVPRLFLELPSYDFAFHQIFIAFRICFVLIFTLFDASFSSISIIHTNHTYKPSTYKLSSYKPSYKLSMYKPSTYES